MTRLNRKQEEVQTESGDLWSCTADKLATSSQLQSINSISCSLEFYFSGREALCDCGREHGLVTNGTTASWQGSSLDLTCGHETFDNYFLFNQAARSAPAGRPFVAQRTGAPPPSWRRRSDLDFLSLLPHPPLPFLCDLVWKWTSDQICGIQSLLGFSTRRSWMPAGIAR